MQRQREHGCIKEMRGVFQRQREQKYIRQRTVVYFRGRENLAVLCKRTV